MKRLGLCRGLVLLAAAAALPLTGLSVSAAEPEKPVLNVGGIEGAGGTITGVVKFNGKQNPRRPIRAVESDAYCAGTHKDHPALEERYVFGDNDTLQNVLVYVSKGLEGKKFEAPKKPALLDQEGCTYVPHVQGVVVGQELKILNSDNTMHNVNCQPKNNPAFNIAQNAKGMEDSKKFNRPEMGIQFKCDVHPWMSSYVHVLDHPFFAVTQQDGSFTLKGLPPGEYEVSVKHMFGPFVPAEETQKVTIAGDESKELTFTYAPRSRD